MNCSKCKYENPEKASFCVNCGAFLSQSSSSEAAAVWQNRNAVATLSYVLGFITGLFLILFEERNVYVRFHAWQSVVTFGVLTTIVILFRLLALMPSYLGILFIVLMWATVALEIASWLVLMVKAYQGQRFLLPLFGEFAERETYGRMQG